MIILLGADIVFLLQILALMLEPPCCLTAHKRQFLKLHPNTDAASHFVAPPVWSRFFLEQSSLQSFKNECNRSFFWFLFGALNMFGSERSLPRGSSRHSDEWDAASPWRRAACRGCSNWYVDLYGWVSGLHQHLSTVVWMRHKSRLLFSCFLPPLLLFSWLKPTPYVPALWSNRHDHMSNAATRLTIIQSRFFPSSNAGPCFLISSVCVCAGFGDLEQVFLLINSSHCWT